MRKPFTLKIGDHLKTAEKKKFYNEQVFSEIAPKYDFITRALSFWQDAAWKDDLIEALPPLEHPYCVDIACGTGDISFLLAEKYPAGDITGVDITELMLEIARQRNTYANIRFVNEDMCHLKIPDGTVDILSGGYALRNAPDLKNAIKEVYRVLRPGGVAAFLDFSKPDNKFLQRLEYAVLKFWTGFWGILLHGNHEVYSYIAESLWAFPRRSLLQEMFSKEGFVITKSQRYFLGITELLVVQRSEVPQERQLFP